MLQKAQKWFEDKTGAPSLEKIPEVLELIKSLDAIHSKKLEQIRDILTLTKELQQASGSEGLALAVELVRLVAEVPEERLKEASRLIQRAERLAKVPAVKEAIETLKGSAEKEP